MLSASFNIEMGQELNMTNSFHNMETPFISLARKVGFVQASLNQ
jgi:hypothetical protein